MMFVSAFNIGLVLFVVNYFLPTYFPFAVGLFIAMSAYAVAEGGHG